MLQTLAQHWPNIESMRSMKSRWSVTEIGQIVDGRCLDGRCLGNNFLRLFFWNVKIFRHLKLEIALAIPASNDEKWTASNSLGRWANIKLALAQCIVSSVENARPGPARYAS